MKPSQPSTDTPNTSSGSPSTEEVPYGKAYRVVVSQEDAENGASNRIPSSEQWIYTTGSSEYLQEGDVIWSRGGWSEDATDIQAEDLAGDATYQETRKRLIEAAEDADYAVLVGAELRADTSLGEYSLARVRGYLLDSPGLQEDSAELKSQYFEVWHANWPKHAADLGLQGSDLDEMLLACGGDVEALMDLASRVSSPRLFLMHYNSGLGLSIDQAVVFCRHNIEEVSELRELIELCGSTEQAVELLEGVSHHYTIDAEELRNKRSLGFTLQQAAEIVHIYDKSLVKVMALPGGEDLEKIVAAASGMDDFSFVQLGFIAERLPGITLDQALWLGDYRRNNGLKAEKIITMAQELGDGDVQSPIDYLEKNPDADLVVD